VGEHGRLAVGGGDSGLDRVYGETVMVKVAMAVAVFWGGGVALSLEAPTNDLI